MFFLNQMSTVLQMGFIYAVVGIGVYITYKILDFPDLSVDGTFPLGGVVFSVLLVAGCPWPVAMLVSFFAGASGAIPKPAFSTARTKSASPVFRSS